MGGDRQLRLNDRANDDPEVTESSEEKKKISTIISMLSISSIIIMHAQMELGDLKSTAEFLSHD